MNWTDLSPLFFITLILLDILDNNTSILVFI